MTDQGDRGSVGEDHVSGGPREYRLPRGVLVRVDVMMDDHGRIFVFTRERLDGMWGEVRNEAAALVAETAVDVLRGFRGAKARDAEEDGDEPDESDTRPGGPRHSSTIPRIRGQDFRQIYA